MRSAHPMTKEKDGRTLFKTIKLMKDDAAAVEKLSEEIKSRYTKLFRV
jgi:iron(III) transport system substrate-binding protein